MGQRRRSPSTTGTASIRCSRSAAPIR
jgi:hypothetical protein